MEIESFVFKGSARVVFTISDDEKWTMRHENVKDIDTQDGPWKMVGPDGFAFAPQSELEVVFYENAKKVIVKEEKLATIIWKELVKLGFNKVGNGKRLMEVFHELSEDEKKDAVKTLDEEHGENILEGMASKASQVQNWRKVWNENSEEIQSYDED